jgi:TRAP-type C4-dicarboxylate transport system permease small subunit
MGITESGMIKALNAIERIILVGMFIIMVSASFLQVLNRNWFHLGMSWLEEAARFAMIYMVMLGTEMGLRDSTQIAVTGFVELFGRTSKLVLNMISKLIVVVFTATVFVSSFSLLALQIRSGQITPTLKIPMYIPYAAVTLGFGLTSIVQISMLTMLVAQNKARSPAEGAQK